MSAIVRTEGLVKRYGRTVAVAGIDLSIDQGEPAGGGIEPRYRHGRC